MGCMISYQGHVYGSCDVIMTYMYLQPTITLYFTVFPSCLENRENKGKLMCGKKSQRNLFLEKVRDFFFNCGFFIYFLSKRHENKIIFFFSGTKPLFFIMIGTNFCHQFECRYLLSFMFTSSDYYIFDNFISKLEYPKF